MGRYFLAQVSFCIISPSQAISKQKQIFDLKLKSHKIRQGFS